MGTEEFWVPAALAAVSGGAQYVNKQQAASRQDADETQSIIDQQQLQQKAVGQVSALTKQIGSNTPQVGKTTGDYVAQLRNNAASAGPKGTSSLAPVSGASSRYGTDVAQSNATVNNYGNTTADEMGQIDSAVRQRQNEGLSMQTLGTNLNTLGAASYTKNFVDQLRAQADGQQNPWVSLFAGMAGNAAKSYTSAGPKSTPLSLTSQYSGGYQPTGGPPDIIQ